jgi:hypothetical protein
MAMHYTPEMIAELQDIGEFNFEDCKAFAVAHLSVTARSVMAKVKALGLVYNVKKTKVLTKIGLFGEEIPFD